ncbi:MAG TPA: TolC family protein [Candidatus Eisenbacteria bacterium]|nr:TolC family protein [Candidatus Eisenbacteria bacterium]
MRKLIAVLFLCLTFVDETSVQAAQAAEVNGTLSLSAVVDEALNSNPEIQAAKRRLEAVRAKAKQATYLEDPEINMEAWGVPLSHPLRYRSANPLIFGVRQKLPFFGKLRLIGEMADQESKTAEEELRAKEQEIAANVKAAYAEYFMASKSVEIYRELLELIGHTSAAAEGLYQVGRAPQQDVIKALLERTELMNRLTWAEKDLVTARARLNALLNRPSGSFLAEPKEPAEIPVHVPTDELEKLVIEQRPELRALESSIARSEKAIELAERNRKYPDFMVGLQYWVAPDQSPRHMYAPMVTLTIPFSPWTKRKHDYEVEEALAERQAAKANLAAMRNMALYEVRDMSAKLQAAIKSLSIYRNGLLPQAEQSFQAAVAAYQTGGVNFMTLLDAQRTIRDVRMGYYKALVDYEQSRAELERVVGKELK